jgi:hypothetical protein
MRCLAFVLVTSLLGCTGTVVSGEEAPMSDAPTGGSDDGGGTVMMPPPTRGFQLASPGIDVAPNEDSTYCYYFKTSNIDQMDIQRWASHIGPGVHDIVLYLTPTVLQPAGTMNSNGCAVADGTGGTSWSYAAQTSDAEMQLPADDGSGKPVGLVVRAGQAGFLQIHVRNMTAAALKADVTLNAFAYPADVQTTHAAPFTALNLNGPSYVMVNAGTAGKPATNTVGGSCLFPPDPSGKPIQFFGITTYTHKQGVHTVVKDGASKIFESTSWEHPGTMTSPQFYTFQSGTLSYQCDYVNGNAYTIMSGDDVTTQEMCMAVGYFFPAPPPPNNFSGHFCVDSFLLY